MAAHLRGLRKAGSAFLSQLQCASPVARTLGRLPPSAIPPRLPELASSSRLQSTSVAAKQQQHEAADQTAGRPPPVNPPEGYNPPETTIPDPLTLADQWQYATSMYSRFSAQAWGMAILTGLTAYGLGWLIKGSNPLSTSLQHEDRDTREDKDDGKLDPETAGGQVESG